MHRSGSFRMGSKSRRRGQVLLIAVLLMILAAMLGSTFAVGLALRTSPNVNVPVRVMRKA